MNTPYKFPVESQINSYMKFSKELIQHYSNESYLIIPEELSVLIKNFIKYKKEHGTIKEKELYKSQTINTVIKRLFTKRPLMFLGSDDYWMDIHGNVGCDDWHLIGTEEEPENLSISKYLTYDEIELSSFLSISILTPIINTGSRRNIGKPDDNHEKEAVYVGQCGARFEKLDRMESKFMLISDEQPSFNKEYMKIWAEFYGVSHFPTHNEVRNDKSGRFVKIEHKNAYLDTLIYKRRLYINAKVFLSDANNRASKFGKKAYVYAVGLGLGAWCIDKELQIKLTIEVYLKTLQSIKFDNIYELYFGWFNIDGLGVKLPSEVNGVKISIGYKDPFELLNNDDLYVVSNWAWDPNSYVGNEYWNGRLGSSGDPAAACCSYVPFFGNPDINDIKKVVIY